MSVGKGDPRWRRVFVKGSDVVSREIAGEALLVPIRGRAADLRCLFSLGGAANFVWKHIDGERDLGAILSAMEQRFDAPSGVLAQDLLDLVDALLEDGLVAERT